MKHPSLVERIGLCTQGGLLLIMYTDTQERSASFPALSVQGVGKIEWPITYPSTSAEQAPCWSGSSCPESLVYKSKTYLHEVKTLI